MSEWKEEILKDVVIKISDRDHFTPTYVEVGIPMISPKDIKENERIDFSNCKYITEEAHQKNRKKTDLKTDDLVFTRIGALLGKICIVENWMPEFSILHSAAMIRANKSVIKPEYLMYFIKSHYFQSQIKNEIQSIGVPDLGLDKINKFKIKYPTDKKKQHKIALVLLSCDKLIEQTQSAIAKYKAIKQGMLHDLFTRGLDASGKLRPTYQQAPELYKESELGMIPKEWEVKRLEECCNEHCSYGINAGSVDFDSKLPLYLRITDITEDGKYNRSSKKCVNDPQSDNYILKENDIVFARTGATVGKTYLYDPNDGKLIYAGFLIKVSPNKNKLNSYFLKSYTETSIYWNWVNVFSQRSGQPGINGNEFGSLGLSIPHISEQNEIAKRFQSIDNKLKSEETLLSKYQSIKRGLMGDLLNGKKGV